MKVKMKIDKATAFGFGVGIISGVVLYKLGVASGREKERKLNKGSEDLELYYIHCVLSKDEELEKALRAGIEEEIKVIAEQKGLV